jgi:putative ABC transport system permease protein
MTRHTRGERWYRRLLRLYPTDFRDEFGGEMTRLYRDRGREERWWMLWASLLLDVVRTAPSEHLAILRQDLRHAWRGLSRTPIITITAMLTLALGVGASTAVFSIVHAVLLRPLPYPESDRLVELFESNLTTGGGMRVSALNYLSWSERAKSFDAIAAFGGAGMTLTDDAGDADPESLGGSIVTASLFAVLRVPPILGRALRPEDELPAAARVVVLGETFWRSRFGGDESIVGRAITLDGQRYQVVGVMPRAFREVGRSQATAVGVGQIFVPMTIDRATEHRANHTLRVVARLRRGVSIDQARNDMRAVAAQLARDFPATNANWSVRLDTLADTTLEPHVHRALLLMLGAVSMVFVIACANVANLMLVRGARRQAELAVRAALGAGRARLVRQLLTESVCLAAISGAAGVLVAAITHPLVRGMLPDTVPRLDETPIDAMRFGLDTNVLAFGLLISIVSGVLFGIAPALRATRSDASHALMHVGRATMDASRARMRQMLTAAQIAVATMLLVGAALLVQGFIRLQHVPLGFDPDGVLTARIALPGSAYPDAERTGQFYERLVTTLEASGQMGSESAVGLATSAPFAPGVRASYRPSTRTGAGANAGASDAVTEDAAEHIVNGGYFRVLRIPLVAGRVFTPRDTANAAGVAVVSQRAARVFWPDANALGQTIDRGGRTFEVIGIVGDVRGSDIQGTLGGGPDRAPRAAVYFAAAQMPQRRMTLLLRPPAVGLAGSVRMPSDRMPDVNATGDASGLVSIFRQTLRQLDPALAVPPVRPLSEWLTDSVAPTRLTTRLAAIFAGSALVLASVGIYGVLAFTVASRTRELGVRMAIGATRGTVIGLVLRDGMTWAIGGIAAGLIAAFAAARLIASLLFEIPARDPLTFAAVGGAVTLVALAASAIPALRAVRIDPTIAMRAE